MFALHPDSQFWIPKHGRYFFTVWDSNFEIVGPTSILVWTLDETPRGFSVRNHNLELAKMAKTLWKLLGQVCLLLTTDSNTLILKQTEWEQVIAGSSGLLYQQPTVCAMGMSFGDHSKWFICNDHSNVHQLSSVKIDSRYFSPLVIYANLFVLQAPWTLFFLFVRRFVRLPNRL